MYSMYCRFDIYTIPKGGYKNKSISWQAIYIQHMTFITFWRITE